MTGIHFIYRNVMLNTDHLKSRNMLNEKDYKIKCINIANVFEFCRLLSLWYFHLTPWYQHASCYSTFGSLNALMSCSILSYMHINSYI